MKKVLSLFALCAMFAFTGCNKKDKEESRSMKKDHMAKKGSCKTCHKSVKSCGCKNKKDKKMKHEKSMKHDKSIKKHGYDKKDKMK